MPTVREFSHLRQIEHPVRCRGQHTNDISGDKTSGSEKNLGKGVTVVSICLPAEKEGGNGKTVGIFNVLFVERRTEALNLPEQGGTAGTFGKKF